MDSAANLDDVTTAMPDFNGPRYLTFLISLKDFGLREIHVDKAQFPNCRWAMTPEIPAQSDMYGFHPGNAAELIINLDPGKERIMFPLINVLSVELIISHNPPGF